MLEANTPSAQIERQSDKDFEAKESTVLEARIPSGPIEQQWDKCRFEMKLVNPANRRKHSVIVMGAGLAGAAAAATLGQQGYHVHCFSYHDTPRRAHSIAAQGGSTPLRTTATTATASSAYSRIRSKAVTSAPARPTSTVSRKSVSILLTNASPRACRSPGNMAGSSTIVPLAACRFHEHFMREVRRDSSCCSALIRRWKSRWRLGR